MRISWTLFFPQLTIFIYLEIFSCFMIIMYSNCSRILKKKEMVFFLHVNYLTLVAEFAYDPGLRIESSGQVTDSEWHPFSSSDGLQLFIVQREASECDAPIIHCIHIEWVKWENHQLHVTHSSEDHSVSSPVRCALCKLLVFKFQPL